jgi:hypothetical protein
MTPREARKLQAEKLKEQKIKPIQKVSNSFIDSTLHKSNLTALKTIYYLSTILDKFDHSKNLDTIKIDLRQMLKYTEINAQDIRNNLKAMQETSITFADEKQQIEEYISLIPRIKFEWGKNVVEIDLYSKIAKLIIDAVGQYSFIDTKQLMKLQNKHSLKLLPILHKLSQYSPNVAKRVSYELEDLNDLFGTKYKRLVDISRYILAPSKEELDAESKLTFVYEIDFVNLGQGRPKANKITIDLVEQKNPQGKLF